MSSELPSSTSWVEKTVIGVALLAGLPLGLVLDAEFLGFRRFVWIGASFLGLWNLLFLDPKSETASSVDKVCLSLLSVALVPHFVQLVKDQTWMGLGVLPPFFMIIHASLHTPLGSEEFWRLRAFLHIFAFILPYLNHLPSAPPPPKTDDEIRHEESAISERSPRPEDNKHGMASNAGNGRPTKQRTNKKKR
ncbi:hypothetical protein IV203_013405 [Nitzschia inconspicua]|uniref:Uncharacterized protein n=1 Tax=Nitzschia inconspicua TaxID=303405 RepID=A0A9K3M6V4_9STRA|nr:hypothetical protein IV203_013405 [Nitzschia inconspicua]